MIGTLVACFLPLNMGKLFYRNLESLKITALGKTYDFDRQNSLSSAAVEDLHWWLEEGLHSGKELILEPPYAFCKSDASGYAWGAIMNGVATHGLWNDGT